MRFVALDLRATGGLSLENEAPVRLVESVGMQILKTSEFTLFCIPTGQDVPWKVDAEDPWLTLPRREPSRVVAVEGSSPISSGGGVLQVTGFCPRQEVRLSGHALARGVWIGRDARCDVVVANNLVSRVHAVMLRFGDELVMTDAGSTNGLCADGCETRSVRMENGSTVDLSDRISVRWVAR